MDFTPVERAKLEKAQIHNWFDVSGATSSSIIRAGFSELEARDLLDRSSQLFPSAIRGQKVLGMTSQVLTTSLRRLDSLLGGGIWCGAVTDFYGEASSGKTQICFQLCVNAVQAGWTVLFVDCLGTFRPERIREMSIAQKLDPSKALSRINVLRVHSSHDQIECVRDLVRRKRDYEKTILIVDGLADHFLTEYGTQGLISRQSSLYRHLIDLSRLALNSELAVVVTNGVRSRLDATEQFVEAGGNATTHVIHCRMMLSRESARFTARILQPNLFSPKLYFTVTADGIIDATE